MADTSPLKSQNEDVKIDVSNSDLNKSIQKGAMDDSPNYRRLLFWAILGTIIFVLFVYMLASMYDYNIYKVEKEVSEASTYYQIEKLEQKEQERLTTFGIINAEEGIYRIPIDRAIDKYIEENGE